MSDNVDGFYCSPTIYMQFLFVHHLNSIRQKKIGLVTCNNTIFIYKSGFLNRFLYTLQKYIADLELLDKKFNKYM